MRPQAPSLFAPPRRQRGRNRRSSDITLAALRHAGRLERVDQALVAAHRAAADNLDDAERSGTPYVVATAVRTYLLATQALYARVGVIADEDDDIWRELSADDAPPLGDTAPA